MKPQKLITRYVLTTRVTAPSLEPKATMDEWPHSLSKLVKLLSLSGQQACQLKNSGQVEFTTNGVSIRYEIDKVDYDLEETERDADVGGVSDSSDSGDNLEAANGQLKVEDPN